MSSIKNKAQTEAVRDNDCSKQKEEPIETTPISGKQKCNVKPYEMCTRTELQVYAKIDGIKGRSKMDKAELIDSLRKNK